MTDTVAALYVIDGGTYFGLDGVDPWPEKRDARLYDGPHPVVAHPPCSRWCRLAGLVQARWGHKRGEDGGCFKAALASVRQWGGVLEHPAHSDAWAAFGLPVPPRSGGWVRGFCGGWVCHVEQGKYGHVAKKATWLYAFNCDLPTLKWGPSPDGSSTALVSWCGNKTRAVEKRPRVGKKQASKSPVAFRDLLIAMARSVPPRSVAVTDTLTEALAQRALSSAPPREPSADDRALLRLWGWRETEAGWWRDPESGGRRSWQRALRVIARDAARGDLPPATGAL